MTTGSTMPLQAAEKMSRCEGVEVKRSLEDIKDAESALLSFLRAHDVDKEKAGACVVILKEATVNAVRYGKGEKVICVYEVNGEADGELAVSVTYETEPFDAAPAPPPLTAEGGRGLLMMRLLSSSIQFMFVEGLVSIQSVL